MNFPPSLWMTQKVHYVKDGGTKGMRGKSRGKCPIPNFYRHIKVTV